MNAIMVIKRKMEQTIEMGTNGKGELVNLLKVLDDKNLTAQTLKDDSTFNIVNEEEVLLHIRFLPIINWLDQKGKEYEIFSDSSARYLTENEFFSYTEVLMTDINLMLSVLRSRSTKDDVTSKLSSILGEDILEEESNPNNLDFDYLKLDLEELRLIILREKDKLEINDSTKLSYHFMVGSMVAKDLLFY